MTVIGNTAVQVEMERLLQVMDRLEREEADTSAEARLQKIRRYIESVRCSARSGWL